jgi:hypothetical protein
MKKRIFTILGILIATFSFAQLTYGPKIGIGAGRIANEMNVISPGFQGGLFVNAELDDRVGIQVECLYSLKGNKHIYNEGLSGDSVFVRTNYRFIDVPVSVYFPISKHLRGFLGPQLSWYRGSSQRYENNSVPIYEKKAKNNLNISGKLSFYGGIDFVFDSPIMVGFRIISTKFTQTSYGLGDQDGSSSGGDDKENKKGLMQFMVQVGYRLDW